MSRLIPMRIVIALLTGMLLATVTVEAQTTWYVDAAAPPGGDGSMKKPFNAIQTGIDAAVNGDTVLVLDGTYTAYGNHDLDFGGRLITVRSEYGPAACVIDCRYEGRAFYFHSGETAEAVVDGFTIHHGYTTSGSPGHSGGGGMLIDGGASPTVTNCTFSGNETYSVGGGMYNRDGTGPTVSNCTFIDNHAHGFDGGGMYNSPGTQTTVINCKFSNNVAHGGGGVGSYGGGMRIRSSAVTVINCTFTGNRAEDGGGMDSASSSPTVVNCTFTGNSGTWGGGICGAARVTNCTFTANSATLGGGVFSGIVRVANCTFSGNSATTYGGGIYAGENSMIANCTLSGNSAPHGGGIHVERGSPMVTNCILWGDSGTEIYSASGSPIVTYCDVQGGYSGMGNIDADPLFTDPASSDYRLSSGSACIDAGDNTAVPADTVDLDGDGDTGEPMPFDLDARLRCVDRIDTPDTGNPDPSHPDMPVVDMGAYEYQCLGDLDGDGAISLADLATLLAHYETTGTMYTDGDLDFDGDVDLADLAALLAVYDTMCE